MTSSFAFIYHSQRITLVCQTLCGTHLTILVLRITCAKACLNAGCSPPSSVPLVLPLPLPSFMPRPLPSALPLPLSPVRSQRILLPHISPSVVPLPPLGRTPVSSPGRLPPHSLRSSFVPVPAALSLALALLLYSLLPVARPRHCVPPPQIRANSLRFGHRHHLLP